MEEDDSSRLPLAGAATRDARVASPAPAGLPYLFAIQPNARGAKRRDALVRR
ncbi:hypothetical protein BSIN_0284 [Burkholderia singularis]|uniref:Uncharacterized protein n=1 Tax=Burkholderia singularis TaxID=1503053 RepID=A0A238H4C7_9BURK|nr:hypothetical protein BSIN_0284 [Burkholderia singularis]